MATINGIVLCVAAREPGPLSYVWRIWAHQTSFYIRPRYTVVGGFKLSLHGPDPRKGMPGFKLALVDEPPAPEEAVLEATPGFLPCWFPGEETRTAAKRVARIRTTWDMFENGVPSGPATGRVKTGFAGTLIAPPPPGFAADVDLIVSEYAPYWGEGEARVRKENAALGPIRNAAGQYLTGLSVRRSLAEEPTPPHILAPEPSTAEDTIRGLVGGVDSRGFVWLAEQRISRIAIQRKDR